MKNKLALFIIVLVVICLPLQISLAATAYNAGFVSGLWYSKVPFFAGETIRIYTAFQNNSKGDITGNVEFFNNDISIGKTNFSAINGHLVETWIDWKVPYGNNSISAKIIEASRSEVGKPPEKIEVTTRESKAETIFADADTDKDQLGDKVDPDIDNDGLSNEEEEKLGTDPTHADTDRDGIGDKKDTTPLPSATETKKESLSLLESIIEPLDSYTENLLQKVEQARDEIKSELKEIDENILKEKEQTDLALLSIPASNKETAAAKKSEKPITKITDGTVIPDAYGAENQASDAPPPDKILLHIKLAALSILALTLENKIVIYLLILLLVYILLRIVWRIFRRRKKI